MEKVINIQGEKIESIAIRKDGMNEHGKTYSLTIQARHELDPLEFTMGMEATLNNAGFKDRHRVVRHEFERRNQDLPLETNENTHALTIRQIPESRIKTIASLIIASLQSAKLLNNKEHMAALAAARLTPKKSSDYTPRTVSDLGKRVYSITIETPAKPIVPDHSRIIVYFQPFTHDNSYQDCYQKALKARDAIMPAGSTGYYPVKMSPTAKNPGFTIEGIPTSEVDMTTRKLVAALIAEELLQASQGTDIFKALNLPPVRRPPSSGQDRLR